MWGSNISDLPRFYDYESAHRFYRTTKPVRTTGAIPLRSNRRQHDQYDVRMGCDSHGEYVACRHYQTELVKFYENGNIGIYPYNSLTSRNFISEVSQFQLSVLAGHPVLDGEHILTGSEVKLRPRSSEERRTGWGRTSAIWIIDNPKEAVGVPIGPGRAYIDKQAGALMRAAKKQRKAMALFAGVSDVGEIAALYPYRERFTEDDVARVAHSWRKGDEIPMWLIAAGPHTFETVDAFMRYEIKAALRPTHGASDWYKARDMETEGCLLNASMRYEIKTALRPPHDVSDWYKARDMLAKGHLLDPQGVLELEDWVHGIAV